MQLIGCMPMLAEKVTVLGLAKGEWQHDAGLRIYGRVSATYFQCGSEWFHGQAMRGRAGSVKWRWSVMQFGTLVVRFCL